MNKHEKKTRHTDVVERYCPMCKDNVVLKRTHGAKTTYVCMNYQNCDHKEDCFCNSEIASVS